MKKTHTFIAALVLVSFAFSACNTIQGAGQDVKAGGQAVSNAAVKTKEEMKEGN